MRHYLKLPLIAALIFTVSSWQDANASHYEEELRRATACWNKALEYELAGNMSARQRWKLAGFMAKAHFFMVRSDNDIFDLPVGKCSVIVRNSFFVTPQVTLQ